MNERKTLLHQVGESTGIQVGLVAMIISAAVAVTLWASAVKSDTSKAVDDISSIKSQVEKVTDSQFQLTLEVVRFNERLSTLDGRVGKIEALSESRNRDQPAPK